MHRRQMEDSGDVTSCDDSLEEDRVRMQRPTSLLDEFSVTKCDSTSTAWLFPGLGSRHVGMGADIIGNYSVADELLNAAEHELGYDPVAVCLEGRSRIALPARQEAQIIYVINCAYAQVLFAQGLQPAYVCGHSLGTWAAAYAGGIYDFLTGLRIVTKVEELLESHIDGQDQAMGVVIGLSESSISQLCTPPDRVFLANYNSDGQYVIAGHSDEVDNVLTRATALGALKTQRITSPRAMHSPLIESIQRKLAEYLRKVPIASAKIPLLNCLDGTILSDAMQLRENFGSFLFRPVYWEQTVHELVNLDIHLFVDVGAGGVLAGMMSFIDQAANAVTASEFLVENSLSS